MGRVAAVAVPLMALVVPASMPFVGYTARETMVWAAVIVPSTAVAGLVAWFVPWRRWPDAALQVVPAGGFTCLMVLGLLSDGRAGVYGGFAALLFLFLGLTQQPWVSVPWLFAAVATNIAMYGGLSAQLAARLPISIVVWLATAEIVSRYRLRTREVMTGLDELARRDVLTGLANRTGLEPRLAALAGQDAVLLVDLDHFKSLNDTAGHSAGDHVLHQFGATVTAAMRAGDTAIRYGGEEFLLVLPGAGREGALRFDARLRDAWLAVRPDVTYSAGIAIATDSPRGPDSTVGAGESTAPVLVRADEALYAAKALGRNRTIVHPPSRAVLSERAGRR
jgi:diguanylate cyclase (GGDEF)-like protein